MKKNITIKVCGYTGVGKSTVIELINNALADYAHDITIITPDDLNDVVRENLISNAPRILSDVDVIIEEVQLQRSSVGKYMVY